MNTIQQFFYRLSPAWVRMQLWGINDKRLLLPQDNLFRFMRDGTD